MDFNSPFGYSENEVFGIPIARASQHCIVCGTKNGTCSSTTEGPNHLVTLGQDEKILHEDEIEVKEDVWEDREIAPGVWTKTLIARAGKVMKKKKAIELGII